MSIRKSDKSIVIITQSAPAPLARRTRLVLAPAVV